MQNIMDKMVNNIIDKFSPLKGFPWDILEDQVHYKETGLFNADYPESRINFLCGGMDECVLQNVLYHFTGRTCKDREPYDLLALQSFKEAMKKEPQLASFVKSMIIGAEKRGFNFRKNDPHEIALREMLLQE